MHMKLFPPPTFKALSLPKRKWRFLWYGQRRRQQDTVYSVQL